MNLNARRQTAKIARVDTFKSVADEWIRLQAKKQAIATAIKTRWMLEHFLIPAIGSRPIGEIAAPDLLAMLRKIETRGTYETAYRVKQLAGRIIRFAVATGRAARDPTDDLRGALAPLVTRNHPAITNPARIGDLLRSIDDYHGHPATTAALKLAPLFFVRPDELRGTEWAEFDLLGAEWRIPAARMKMREAHIVPLSRQAMEIVRELKSLTGNGATSSLLYAAGIGRCRTTQLTPLCVGSGIRRTR